MDEVRSIVVGIDFTEGSRAALAQAQRLAAALGATVHAVHMLEPLVVSDLQAALSRSHDDVRASLLADAQVAWKEFAPDAGGAVKFETHIGHPIEGTVAAVTRHAADVELQAVIESDGELAEHEFELELATALRFAGPWGQHFPEPVFDGLFRIVNQRLVGEKHLKLVLFPAAGSLLLDAIAFNVDLEVWPDPSIEQVEIAYRLDVNEFRGQRTVQLVIEHLVPG